MSPLPISKAWHCLLIALVLFCAGCGEDLQAPWREQKLPSGRSVKVTAFYLAWADEHGERTTDHDAFDLEYVATNPDATAEAREQEAKEVFELIRPGAELWKLNNASVAGFRTTTRKGKYDLYVFRRGADGRWSTEHIARKVFVTD